MKDFILTNRWIPGANLIEKAQNVILFPQKNYTSKPYLSTTQNQTYLKTTIPHDAQSACIILGSGDTLFLLLQNGIKKITAIELNPLQIMMYKLRMAAIKTLNPNEFENFLLNKRSIHFFSPRVFSTVKDGLTSDADLFFWQAFFSLNSKEDVLNYYIKGGIEQTNIQTIRSVLPYVKRKYNYYKVRQALEEAEIQIHSGNAIDFLENSTNTWDYIDITNILVTTYQEICNSKIKKFEKIIKKLSKIYEKNLNANGNMVLDYMFGISFDNLNCSQPSDRSHTVAGQLSEIYWTTYQLLNMYFKNLNCKSIDAIDWATPLHEEIDTVLYVSK